jgi:hypothetical protein
LKWSGTSAAWIPALIAQAAITISRSMAADRSISFVCAASGRFLTAPTEHRHASQRANVRVSHQDVAAVDRA